MRIEGPSWRALVTPLTVVAALAVWVAVGRSQEPHRYLYAALPGVGGGSNLDYGGSGILVFDIDHGHRFVKRVPLPALPPAPPSTRAGRGRGRGGPGRGGRGGAGRGNNGPEAIKGIAANATTNRLYVSTSRRVLAFDLTTDKLLWEKNWDGHGTD